jgi:hypothetical protein
MAESDTALDTELGPAELVETDLKDETSVPDSQFYLAADNYGDEYVDLYLEDVSQALGDTVVEAFEQHDKQNYHTARDMFKTVYNMLFPVSEEAALEAANGYVSALAHHDVIEDGAKEVEHYLFDEEYDEDERLLTANEIGEAPGWENVKTGFYMMETQLELPSTYAGEDGFTYSYHIHQTEFFRHHTIARESTDHDETDEYTSYAEMRMREHAQKAQLVKFGSIIDINNISDAARSEILPHSPLDEEATLMDHITATYLDAVDSHDRHTKADQQANRERMAALYRSVMRQVIDQQ